MIEEMDFKGDGRINKTIFHLHQASSFSASTSSKYSRHSLKKTHCISEIEEKAVDEN